MQRLVTERERGDYSPSKEGNGYCAAACYREREREREVAALAAEQNIMYFPKFVFRNIVYISYIIFLTV